MRDVTFATDKELPIYDSILQVFTESNRWDDYATIKNDEDRQNSIKIVRNSLRHRIKVTVDCSNTYYGMIDTTSYQILSRNSDSNGNPYRLLIVYGLTGRMVKAIECRDSIPNCESLFSDIPRLPSFRLSATEYKNIKTTVSKMLASEANFMNAVRSD